MELINIPDIWYCIIFPYCKIDDLYALYHTNKFFNKSLKNRWHNNGSFAHLAHLVKPELFDMKCLYFPTIFRPNIPYSITLFRGTLIERVCKRKFKQNYVEYKYKKLSEEYYKIITNKITNIL